MVGQTNPISFQRAKSLQIVYVTYMFLFNMWFFKQTKIFVIGKFPLVSEGLRTKRL